MKKICYVLTVPITVRAFFLPQLKYLATNGFDITVICSSDGKLQAELGECIRYIPLDMPRGISLFKSISVIHEMIKIMKKEQFDLVQYSTPNAAFYASIASKLVGVKVRNYHLMGFRYLGATGIAKNILKLVEKIACILSTHIECVSHSNLEFGVAEKVFKRDKVTVVWNGSTGGVDLERFDIKKRELWRKQIRSELGYNDEDFVYGFVGRITRDKGVDELLEAYFQLSDDSKLLFIGNMEAKETLNAEFLKKAYACPNVQFHDSVKDIERYYAAIDVLILPSYREGFGNVVIEAAALGVPAIVSDIPGPIDAILPDITAKVVPVKDKIQLKNAMSDMKYNNLELMRNSVVSFVENHFDSVKLCKKILDRKNTLLHSEEV